MISGLALSLPRWELALSGAGEYWRAHRLRSGHPFRTRSSGVRERLPVAAAGKVLTEDDLIGFTKSSLWWAVRHTRMGRSVVSKRNVDKKYGDVYERMARFDQCDIADFVGRATPVPDAVSFRVDTPVFMAAQRKPAGMAAALMGGMTTTDVAAGSGSAWGSSRSSGPASSCSGGSSLATSDVSRTDGPARGADPRAGAFSSDRPGGVSDGVHDGNPDLGQPGGVAELDQVEHLPGFDGHPAASKVGRAVDLDRVSVEDPDGAGQVEGQGVSVGFQCHAHGSIPPVSSLSRAGTALVKRTVAERGATP